MYTAKIYSIHSLQTREAGVFARAMLIFDSDFELDRSVSSAAWGYIPIRIWGLLQSKYSEANETKFVKTYCNTFRIWQLLAGIEVYKNMTSDDTVVDFVTTLALKLNPDLDLACQKSIDSSSGAYVWVIYDTSKITLREITLLYWQRMFEIALIDSNSIYCRNIIMPCAHLRFMMKQDFSLCIKLAFNLPSDTELKIEYTSKCQALLRRMGLCTQ